MDMRKVDVYAAATSGTWTRTLTLLNDDIPKVFWMEENKPTTRDLSILRNYAFNKNQVYLPIVPLQMMVEKSVPTNVSCGGF